MKNIELYKEETLKDARYPQEEKYPSKTVLAIGHMWPWTIPKVGKVFHVMYSKLIPKLHTSVVTEIISETEEEIKIKTQNSIYTIKILKDGD